MDEIDSAKQQLLASIEEAFQTLKEQALLKFKSAFDSLENGKARSESLLNQSERLREAYESRHNPVKRSQEELSWQEV